MKGILKRVVTKLSRRSAIAEADKRQSPVEESHEPGKDVPMPDIYACDDTITQREVKTLDESSLDDSESAGVDPYNRG